MTGVRMMHGAVVLALAQMTAPATADAAVMLVPICGEPGGRTLPIRLPGRRDGPAGAPCCKICHGPMRKRAGGENCCDAQDDPDAG